MTGISEVMSSVLRSARAELNASFALAKKQYPALEGPAFLGFLSSTLDPVVAAVHACAPERVADVVRAGYAVGLDLVGQRVAARCPSVELCFQRVLPPVAAHVARAPERVIGALVNAAHNLDAAGARAEQWLTLMASLGPRCADVEALLQLGQLCAWRAGLAHYRESALELAFLLPEEITHAALGLPDDQRFSELREAFEHDPWFIPGTSRWHNPRVAAHVGAFRGFGGLFREPPRVHAHDGQLVVRSCDASWLLIADAFGATFHRASAEEHANCSTPTSSDWEVTRDRLLGRTTFSRLETPGKITSFAYNEHTLALTSTCTHRIALVALKSMRWK